jgi:hypothetical protein
MRILLAIIITFATFTYLLPFAVAVGRGRTNTPAIFILNLFLGWTLIGWIIALVWACAHDEVRSNRVTV